MALSNWLTRDEWNAVYFAGLKSAIDGATCENLGDQMKLGIASLYKAGWSFRGITADEHGGFEKVSQCCEGNERCLAEMIDGSFDKVGRARETLAFVESSGLNVDFSWLKDALSEIGNGEGADSE